MVNEGRILIIIGVSAWVPYLALTFLLHVNTAVAPFLAVHLMGVIPGSFFSRHPIVRGVREMNRIGKEMDQGM